jgi:hypothetical protein
MLPVLLIESCKEDEPVIYNFGISSEEYMQAYLSYSYIFFHVDEVLKNAEDSLIANPSGIYHWRGIQVTITPSDTATFPKSFTLEYQPARFPDSIRGTVAGTLSGHYLEAGTVVAYGFDELIINRGLVNGNCSIGSEGIFQGMYLFHFEITGASIEKYSGTDSAALIAFAGTQEVFWSESPDQLQIPEGAFYGMATDSLQFTAVVKDTYPIIKEQDCTYIRDGIFDYEVNNANNVEVGVGIVDFGYYDPMICDKFAIIVVDGDGYRSEFYYIMEW